MSNDIFSSKQHLQQVFNQGLLRLSADSSLGTFILVLANASFDPAIYAQTRDTLYQNFSALKEIYTTAFRAGRQVREVEEDLLVFLKILCAGFENLNTTLFRNEGGWEIQFNHVRGFRPARISQEKIESLYQDYSSTAFNFNKPFLAKEMLWQGDFHDQSISLFYNKYPFTHYHTLLVPEREQNHPQYIKEKQHYLIWQLLQEHGHRIEGMGAGYNSRGAYASVNHLHFQLFVRDIPLPVMDARWRHNGGEQDYPSACVAFSDVRQSLQYIDELQQSNTAFNLLYFPGGVYCFPRKLQGSYVHADWTSGFSWYELAGGIMTASHDTYQSLGADEIINEFNKLQLAE